MADKAESKVVYLKVKTVNGKESVLSCSQSTASLLQSPDTDPAVKQDIINSLLKAAPGQNETEPGVGPKCQEKEFATDCNNNRTEVPHTTPFHVWTEKEEDILVNLRHELIDDFTRTRNHNKLWMKVSDELQEVGCKVTPTQALNKYSSLKKKYKEVVDAPSGSGTKYFRHFDNFNIVYGTKASTKPGATIDTVQPEGESEQHEKQKTVKVKADKKVKRQAEGDVVQMMKDQYKDFKGVMEHQHVQKMSRMDRMLDLYERELDQNQKQT